MDGRYGLRFSRDFKSTKRKLELSRTVSSLGLNHRNRIRHTGLGIALGVQRTAANSCYIITRELSDKQLSQLSTLSLLTWLQDALQKFWKITSELVRAHSEVDPSGSSINGQGLCSGATPLLRRLATGLVAPRSGPALHSFINRTRNNGLLAKTNTQLNEQQHAPVHGQRKPRSEESQTLRTDVRTSTAGALFLEDAQAIVVESQYDDVNRAAHRPAPALEITEQVIA